MESPPGWTLKNSAKIVSLQFTVTEVSIDFTLQGLQTDAGKATDAQRHGNEDPVGARQRKRARQQRHAVKHGTRFTAAHLVADGAIVPATRTTWQKLDDVFREKRDVAKAALAQERSDQLAIDNFYAQGGLGFARSLDASGQVTVEVGSAKANMPRCIYFPDTAFEHYEYKNIGLLDRAKFLAQQSGAKSSMRTLTDSLESFWLACTSVIQHRVVDVLQTDKGPPSLSTHLCHSANDCLCSFKGKQTAAIHERSHSLAASEHPPKSSLRLALQIAKVMMMLLGRKPDMCSSSIVSSLKAGSAVVRWHFLADCLVSPIEFFIHVFSLLPEHEDDIKICGNNIVCGSVVRLYSARQDLTDWEAAKKLDVDLVWHVAWWDIYVR